MVQESRRLQDIILKLVNRNKNLQDELSSAKVDLMISKEAFRQEQQELKSAIVTIEKLREMPLSSAGYIVNFVELIGMLSPFKPLLSLS